jgi:RNA polymerase sigma-70 factor (ECF subfamily)
MATRDEMVDVGASNPLSDDEIVRAVLTGERALFEVLMRRHNQRVYRAVRAVLRDEAEVEDVMQQAYVAAYTHLAQFAGAARFSTWLVKIAVNEAFARIRRRGRVVAFSGLDAQGDEMKPAESNAQDPERRAIAREMMAVLETAVDALPDAYRAVFMLREVEGLSTAEVAGCLDLTEENVKVRLHRAKGMLREDLFTRVGRTAAEAFRFEAPRCNRVVAGVFGRLSQA